jgi:hypothetical protein
MAPNEVGEVVAAETASNGWEKGNDQGSEQVHPLRFCSVRQADRKAFVKAKTLVSCLLVFLSRD